MDSNYSQELFEVRSRFRWIFHLWLLLGCSMNYPASTTHELVSEYAAIVFDLHELSMSVMDVHGTSRVSHGSSMDHPWMLMDRSWTPIFKHPWIPDAFP